MESFSSAFGASVPRAAFRGLTRLVQARVDRFGRAIVPGALVGRPISIDRLICPLRYDLWIRTEFIHLLRNAWALYEADLDAFCERPEARAYFIWFKEVECARFHPVLYPHEGLLRRRFLRRVHDTARLWRSMTTEGYDRSKPIRLVSGRSIGTVNGKRVAARLFAGDGCHRLACLYDAGHTRLEPGHYEVELLRRFQPLDNTAILVPALQLDRAAYLRFISRFYCDGTPASTVDEIRRQVAAHEPQLLPELESVLAYDLARV